MTSVQQSQIGLRRCALLARYHGTIGAERRKVHTTSAPAWFTAPSPLVIQRSKLEQRPLPRSLKKHCSEFSMQLASMDCVTRRLLPGSLLNGFKISFGGRTTTKPLSLKLTSVPAQPEKSSSRRATSPGNAQSRSRTAAPRNGAILERQPPGLASRSLSNRMVGSCGCNFYGY